MAPTKPTSSKKGGPSKSGGSKGGSSSSFSKSKPSSSSSKSAVRRPPPKEQKSKPRTVQEKLKKKRNKVYSEKELDLPSLNMITPVGVQKPRGKKKGKIFVDDQESMMTILAMVNAEKEGQIESKMMKARQLEEIRQARKDEAEARQEQRKAKLEEVKKSLKKKKSKSTLGGADAGAAAEKPTKGKKKVAFL